LDSIATVTLLLDISTVSEWFYGLLAGSGSNDSSANQADSGKAARISARAARVVRVLRLVRLVKIYKNILDQHQKQVEKKKEALKKGKDWIVWSEEEADDEDEEELAESNVGKHLTDLTTRKLVILILTLMAILPMLQPVGPFTGMFGPSAPSSQIGADLIVDAFDRMILDDTEDNRLAYERVFLTQAYFHNWFSELSDEGKCMHSKACPAKDKFQPKLFWAGLWSEDASLRREKARSAILRSSTVDTYDTDVLEQSRTGQSKWSTDTMPSDARASFSNTWNKECQTPFGRQGARLGFSLLSDSSSLGDFRRGSFPKQVDCPEELRMAETEAVSPLRDRGRKYKFVFVFDNRQRLHQEAYLNLMQTIIVCIMLVGGSAVFSRDAQKLVLKPVEFISNQVELIRKNPMNATKLSDKTFKNEEIRKAKSAKARLQARDTRGVTTLWMKIKEVYTYLTVDSDQVKKIPMETLIVEKTIVKLGTLLALGFGTAGMGVISANLKLDSAGVDAMIAGSTRQCIIGAIRLDHFATFTEVLKGKVMKFVNQVSEVIHGVTDACHGAPNRNNGDTFLVVWVLHRASGGILTDVQISKLADMAMLASGLIVAGIHRSGRLASYRTHPGIQQRLKGNSRVNVTIGIHAGWAIEGTLGTDYKIDATYVSPTVSVAEIVCSAAHAYGTRVLITEKVHGMMCPKMAAHLRLIDRVKIKASRSEMELYTLDLDFMTHRLTVEEPIDIKWNSYQRFYARQCLENEKNERLHPDVHISDIFEDHEDITTMRQSYCLEFREVFGMAYQNYVQGEWLSAQRLLLRALEVLGFEDGPSHALLRFLATYDFQAPLGWKGFHPLDDMTVGRQRQGQRGTGTQPVPEDTDLIASAEAETSPEQIRTFFSTCSTVTPAMSVTTGTPCNPLTTILSTKSSASGSAAPSPDLATGSRSNNPAKLGAESSTSPTCAPTKKTMTVKVVKRKSVKQGTADAKQLAEGSTMKARPSTASKKPQVEEGASSPTNGPTKKKIIKVIAPSKTAPKPQQGPSEKLLPQV
jgi:class 3 adenylate cyclase